MSRFLSDCEPLRLTYFMTIFPFIYRLLVYFLKTISSFPYDDFVLITVTDLLWEIFVGGHCLIQSEQCF